MSTEFDLTEYLNNGIRKVIADLTKASAGNPRMVSYMASFALSARKAKARRAALARHGHHVPPFLLGSITDACNLNCRGCYAHKAETCRDSRDEQLLTTDQWNSIFSQAEDLGVCYMILAGGEPFLRQDVLTRAARHKKILFPVITNGILLGEKEVDFLHKNVNLIPVLSVEGDHHMTDDRRGDGVSALIDRSMDRLQEAGIFFGVSITVTRENMGQVLSDAFLDHLHDKGCRGVIYIEYVPAAEGTDDLVPTEIDRQQMMDRISAIREDYNHMIFIAFPGDEQLSAGCLAAGRGFFHINPYGGAEPCPFSPYSDVNLKHTTLRKTLDSPLFRALTAGELLAESHSGGCTLFAHDGEVQEIIRNLQ